MILKLRYWRKSVMLTLLGGVAALSLLAAFMLRFEFLIPRVELAHLKAGLLIAICIKLIVFHLFRCDRGGWRYTGLADMNVLLAANLSGSILFALSAFALYGASFPRSVYCIDLLICFLGTAGMQLAVRIHQAVEWNGRTRQGRTDLWGRLRWHHAAARDSFERRARLASPRVIG